jgi:hypothetical protein
VVVVLVVRGWQGWAELSLNGGEYSHRMLFLPGRAEEFTFAMTCT